MVQTIRNETRSADPSKVSQQDAAQEAAKRFDAFCPPVMTTSWTHCPAVLWLPRR